MRRRSRRPGTALPVLGPPTRCTRAARAPLGRSGATGSNGRWRNGTTFVDHEPLELNERLEPLIPMPRIHFLFHHGLLAPHARLRPSIVPLARVPDAPGAPGGTHEVDASNDSPALKRRPETWVQRFARGGVIDALAGPSGPSGPRQLISFITPLRPFARSRSPWDCRRGRREDLRSAPPQRDVDLESLVPWLPA